MTKFDRYTITRALTFYVESINREISLNTVNTPEHRSELIQRNHKTVQGIIERLWGEKE